MITTKKPGPPVPPRPNATSLAKSQSSSSVCLPPGRTVIYKSPSYVQPTKSRSEDHAENMIDGSNNNHALPHKVTRTTAMLTRRAAHSTDNGFTPHCDDDDDGICGNRTEIIATNNAISVSNANSKNKPNVILDSGIDNSHVLHELERENGSDDNNRWENSHKLEIVQKSPVARPRQNVLGKKLNGENARETMSMSRVIVLGENDRSNKNIDELHYNRSSADDLIEIRNEPVIAQVERSSIDKFETDSNLENTNNLKNLNGYGKVVEKLFTEIAVSTPAGNTQENHSKLEHCIQVRTPSPPNVKISDTNLSQITKVILQSDNVEDINEDKVVTSTDKKVTFHEQLISELTEMHKVEKPRTRYSSSCSNDSSPNGTHRSRIRTADWVEVGDNGKEVMLSSCQISLEDSGMEDEERLDDISSGVGDSWDSVKDGADERMSLPGLPPLPKSLSTLESAGTHPHNTSNFGSIESQRGVSPVNRKTSTLDAQLAILRREMSIKKEIELRLDCIQRIAYEPQLIWDDDSRYILKPDASLPPYYYRFKAVDDIKILEKEIAKQDGSVRTPRDSFRAFLLSTLSATLNGNGQRLIHQFCDMYDMARHDPNEFGNEEYEAYRRLLLKLLDAAKTLKAFSNSRKSSPSRTPVKKQTKVQSLLDPSRLRPPPITSPSSGELLSPNTRLNIALSMQQDHNHHNDDEILSISIPGESHVV